MAIAKASGKMPGNMVLFVNDVLKPVHDWKAELRRFLAQAARNDYSWQRPNPRYAYMGLYLPDLYSEAMPPIVIAVDTSGSVSRKQLAQFTAEMESIKQEAHASQIAVVYCDAVVNHTRIFEPGEPLEIEHKGGGGTSFVPPFAWVSNQGEITPAALIYLTDGECNEFPSAPDYPVLWTILGYYRRFQPPFGEVIHLSR